MDSELWYANHSFTATQNAEWAVKKTAKVDES
jgi:hypothetical protein